jgi:hypothetical protein
MRVAPHRLYQKLAIEFLNRGIGVLRVDFSGLGDSEGELTEQNLDQLYRAVQLGRHVDDVLCAINHVGKEFGARKFVVGGLCGGALTGLLAAERDSRILGVYAIGIPVVLDGARQHEAVNMTQGQLGSLRKRYLRKLRSPEAWARFLSLRTDYRLLAYSLLGRFRRSSTQRLNVSAHADYPPPTRPPSSNLNLAFVRAMFRLLDSGTPALFLFSGNDRLQWEFQEKFVELWPHALQSAADRWRVEIIPGANHVLGDPSWVAEARRLTGLWLDRLLTGRPA